MTLTASIRTLARIAALTGAACCLCAMPAAAVSQAVHASRPSGTRPPSPDDRHGPAAPRRANPNLPNGPHIGGWLEQHSNQTPAQRMQALEREPGFHDLPPQTQQRMRDHLAQIDNMPPQKRENYIAHAEAMERLSPEQRGQVRSSMQQLASLPPASQRAVRRTFRAIRSMTPGERQAYLNSPDIRSQFSDQERTTLFSLMAIEPYLPPIVPAPAPPQ